MSVFQFQRKKESDKTGFISYVFGNGQYSLTIHAIPNEKREKEILYPIRVKAVGQDIDITPDINIMSKKEIDLALPPSITLEQVPQFKDYLETLPGVINSLKDCIEKIERGDL